MPKFVYSVILLDLLFLVGLVFVTLSLSPTSLLNRVAFLITLLGTLTFATSLIFYKLGYLKKRLFVEPRYLYRKMLRRGFFVALATSLLLGLKFQGEATKINVFLLVSFFVALEIFFSTRK